MLSLFCRPSLQFHAACIVTAIAKTDEISFQKLVDAKVIPVLVWRLNEPHQNIVEETLRALG